MKISRNVKVALGVLIIGGTVGCVLGVIYALLNVLFVEKAVFVEPSKSFLIFEIVAAFTVLIGLVGYVVPKLARNRWGFFREAQEV